MDKLRLSMVCCASKVGDVDGNTRRVLEILRGCPDSDIACFPEMVVPGYAMPESASYGQTLDSPFVSGIVDATAENGNCACFGILEDGKYITHVVAEDGRIVGKHRKTHLGIREAKVVEQGDVLDVIRTKHAVLALQVCWESHFPEITTTYGLKGADIVLMPHASGLVPERREETWHRILPARAYDNTVFVASCNQIGANGVGTQFYGGACIIDPRGNIICEKYGEECVLSADIDGSGLDKIRDSDPNVMKDHYYLDKRRPELYL